MARVSVSAFPTLNDGIMSLDETQPQQAWEIAETRRNDLMQQNRTRIGATLLIWTVLIAGLSFFRYRDAGLRASGYVLVGLLFVPNAGWAFALIQSGEGQVFTALLWAIVSVILTPLTILTALFKKSVLI